ncbi:hypothetical protein [Streptomyces sp. NPDC005760]|uniref:hypothetical protein n=1 Tax=Streptomyces sp. NPDC005760 TaxID=3156718 RepID=UPI00340D72DF
MAAQYYQVDLDEMDLAIRRLYEVARRLENARLKAHHETGLAHEALGKEFAEVYEFNAAQASVKIHMEQVSTHLRSLAEEFIRKLKLTRDAYENAET